MKFDIIPKTNKEYKSKTYGCIRYTYSYRILSSSLDSLIKTLVDKINKTMKNLEDENVENDGTLDIVNEIIKHDKAIKDLKKDYPDKIKNLEDALLN